MKALICALIVTVLSGCATTTPVVIQAEPKAIIKIERVITTLPSDLLEIPDPVLSLPLEVLKTDDRAVAKWLLDSEDRTLSLEARLRQIRELYIKQLRAARAANIKEGVTPPAAPASAP